MLRHAPWFFYDPKHQEYLDKLLSVFSVDALLVQPFAPQTLIDTIEALSSSG